MTTNGSFWKNPAFGKEQGGGGTRGKSIPSERILADVFPDSRECRKGKVQGGVIIEREGGQTYLEESGSRGLRTRMPSVSRSLSHEEAGLEKREGRDRERKDKEERY